MSDRSALETGGYQERYANREFTGWRSMDTAPRDGTWVELKCTYGVAPWYCVARWTEEIITATGTTFRGRASWQKLQGGGPFDEGSLHWRPYEGDPAAYVDPTCGMQNDMAYWRGAVASKYGLPLDHFEELAARNEKRNQESLRPKKSWWRRFFG